MSPGSGLINDDEWVMKARQMVGQYRYLIGVTIAIGMSLLYMHKIYIRLYIFIYV